MYVLKLSLVRRLSFLVVFLVVLALPACGRAPRNRWRAKQFKIAAAQAIKKEKSQLFCERPTEDSRIESSRSLNNQGDTHWLSFAQNISVPKASNFGLKAWGLRSGGDDVSDVVHAPDISALLAICQKHRGDSHCTAERIAQTLHRLKLLASSSSRPFRSKRLVNEDARMQDNSFLDPVADVSRANAVDDILAIISKRAMEVISTFKPRHVGMLLNSYAAVKRDPGVTLFDAIASHCCSRMDDFEPQHIANILSSCAKLQFSPGKELFEALCRHSCTRMEDFETQSMSNVLWACAKLGHNPGPEFLESLRVQALAESSEFQPQGIANLLWGYAKLGEQPGKELFERLRECALEHMDDFQPQHIANVLWACAELRQKVDDKFFGEICAHAGSRMAEFDAQAIANMLWACAEMKHGPPKQVFDALSGQALARLNQFEPQGVANMLSACAKLRKPPSVPLFRGLCARAQARMGDFTSQNMANFLWACTEFDQLPSHEVFQSMCAHALTCIHDFEPRGLAIFLWSCAKLALDPGKALFQALCARAIAHVNRLDMHSIAVTLWSCAVFGYISDGLRLLLCAREQAVPFRNNVDTWQVAHLAQIHQFMLSVDLEDECTDADPQAYAAFEHFRDSLGTRGRDALFACRTKLSALQRDVAATLRRVGCTCTEEAVDAVSGYSIDVLVVVMLHPHVDAHTQTHANLRGGGDAQGQGRGEGWTSRGTNAMPERTEYVRGGDLRTVPHTTVAGSDRGSVDMRAHVQCAGDAERGIEVSVMSDQSGVVAREGGATAQNNVHVQKPYAPGANVHVHTAWPANTRVAHMQGNQAGDNQAAHVNGHGTEERVQLAGGTGEASAELFAGQLGQSVDHVEVSSQHRAVDNHEYARARTSAAEPHQAGDNHEYASAHILVTPQSGGWRGSPGHGKIAVEVDGPFHFVARGQSPNGGTLLKRRHLQLLGYKVVSVPYWDWDACETGGSNAKDKYARRMVRQAMGDNTV